MTSYNTLPAAREPAAFGPANPPALFRNMRDGTFADVAEDVGLGQRGQFTCVAAGDINKDGFTDFFLGRAPARGERSA